MLRLFYLHRRAVGSKVAHAVATVSGVAAVQRRSDWWRARIARSIGSGRCKGPRSGVVAIGDHLMRPL